MPAAEASLSSRPRGELRRLTAIRGIAAGLVFGYHMGKHTNWIPQEWVFASGFAGVAFFFVLSGFVLTWSFRPSGSVREFYLRRFARVYPSHFVTALVALVVPVTAYPITLAATAANLPLLQAWFPQWDIVFSLNAVSWSLSCEAFFYALAPWVIGWAERSSTRRAVGVLGAWFGVGVALNLVLGFASQATDIFAYANPALRSGEFALGIALATVVRRGWRPRLPLVVVWPLTGLCLVLAAWWHGPQAVTDMVLVGPFAAVIVGSAVADLEGKRGLGDHPVLHYLGRASYAFYLVHELVILNLVPLAPQAMNGTTKLVGVVVLLVVSVGLAALLHHLVEMAAQKAILAWGIPRVRRGVDRA